MTVANMTLGDQDAGSAFDLPQLPTKSAKDFIPYITQRGQDGMNKLLEPYKAYEDTLRKIYAQQPSHVITSDGLVNLVPIFAGQEASLKIRARKLDAECEREREKYIMPLKAIDRKPDGAPAIVSSLRDFQANFNLFTELSLTDLDWSNVVVAGSAVTTCLLPIPAKWATSKKKKREWYHEHLAPASDVDLFLYGLDKKQALVKMKHIERAVRDSLLTEVTTVRTKHCITIVSQYPTRHVQIVLRLYPSLSQILTGFDVDCACVAYTGSQVYASPRALASFLTQCNTLDLGRRSPSYENRLSKYSHRGFEVHWPLLDRTRIDPTIYERSFSRTVGLARLLVLEILPKTQDRERYVDQRREERGQPALDRGYQGDGDNVKTQAEDEVADWVMLEAASEANYHTLTIPYGPQYEPKRIERILYAKDLLLNAEWNRQNDEREVYLHRHPSFFGTIDQVIEDCCGDCPKPISDEEIEAAQKDSQCYISGDLEFLIENPGRQEIGSFNPVTGDDFTTMAYIGDTERLCQAIVDADVNYVKEWCEQDGNDVNTRDYTGRTPLHLAVMCSSSEVVGCLVEKGARMIARLGDGRTALHIAAARGNIEMIKILMNRSLANQEEEDTKLEARRAARRSERKEVKDGEDDVDEPEEDKSDHEASERRPSSNVKSEDDVDCPMTISSFVEVPWPEEHTEINPQEESREDPDIYDIDATAWDSGLASLHFAILTGHLEVIELLVSEYGAQVLLPVKLKQMGPFQRPMAILSLLLTLHLEPVKARQTAKLLLDLGASPRQADMNHTTALHFIAASNNVDVLDVVLDADLSAKRVLNTLSGAISLHSPLGTAIGFKFESVVLRLLDAGANPTVEFEDWIEPYLREHSWNRFDSSAQNLSSFQHRFAQPVIVAAATEMPAIVEALLDKGADVNAMTPLGYAKLSNPAQKDPGETLLDVVQNQLRRLKKFDAFAKNLRRPEDLLFENHYLKGLEEGSYAYWSALRDYQTKKRAVDEECQKYHEAIAKKPDQGTKEKMIAVQRLIGEFETVEKVIRQKGGRNFYDCNILVSCIRWASELIRWTVQPGVEQSVSSRTSFYNITGKMRAFEGTLYKTSFDWAIPNLDAKMKAGYMKLFEAVWANDLETIKSMTLGSWGPEEKLNPPLPIAVADSNGFSPFSIAILRGSRDLAARIVQICRLQYHRDDGKMHQRKWKVADGDGCTDASDSKYRGDDLPIISELVSDTLTVEHLGEVQNAVKSTILPKTMMEWRCRAHRFDDSHDEQVGDPSITLLEYAVEKDSLDLVKLLIKIGADDQAISVEDDDEPRSYAIDRDVFKKAIGLGRTAILGEMISTTGVGLPWTEIIKSNGLELKTKRQYYQGLKVDGMKRADWAQAPGSGFQTKEEKVPPLLQAARAGNVESVEWLMSDAPMRHYRAWKEANERDRRVKTLEDAKGGFDGRIRRWLSGDSALTLHCAILYNPDKDQDLPRYLALIKHLVSVNPDFLEQPSSEGHTPLHVSIYAQKPVLISYLIACSTNQRHRDKFGRNILHAMVVTAGGQARADAKLLSEIVGLFDEEAVRAMMLERCSIWPGSLTPLALWLACNKPGYASKMWYKSDVLEVLMRYAGDDMRILNLVNGEGESPVHVTVKTHLPVLTQYLLSLRPSSLLRESATGRTPLEMSHSAYTAKLVSAPPQIQRSMHFFDGDYERGSITTRPVGDFVIQSEEQKWQDEWEMEDVQKTWLVCESMHRGDEVEMKRKDEKKQKPEWKRKLVSLGEANEIARRLGGKMSDLGDVFSPSPRTGDSDKASSERDSDHSRRMRDDWRSTAGDFARMKQSRRRDVVALWMDGF